MLQVPFKKAVPIDWVTPLVSYVEREYSTNTAEEFREDFQCFQALRNAAVGVSTASDEGRASLLSYHAQAALATPRLHVNANDLVVPFTWHDSFIKGKNAQQSYLHFECAAVLWNLGALESHCAASEERISDAGLKKACKYFQLSAGYFAYLRDVTLPLLAGHGMLTPDLSPSGVGLSLNLMLGQAQACYYDMAVRMKSMRPSVLAKLAKQVSIYMNKALEDARGPALEGQLDASWAAHIEYQALSFEAAAQWWQSIHVQAAAKEAGKGYAEEISRIKLSQAAAIRALAVGTANSMAAAVMASCTQLLGKLASNLEVAVADNRTVYLEVEPNPDTLPDIVAASPVSPTPPDLGFGAPPPSAAAATETAAAGVQPLFKGLLPVPVMRAIEGCRTKVATVASRVEASAKQATKDARAALSAAGLPGSIAASQDEAGFPEPLWLRVKGVQEAGGQWALQKRTQDCAGLALRANDLLVALQRTLEAEFASDGDFRRSAAASSGSGGAQATLPQTSRESASHFESEVTRYGGLYSQGRMEDEDLRTRVDGEAFRSDLALLGKGRQQLDALLPRRDLLDDAQALKASTADPGPLSNELMVLAELLKQREVLLAQLSGASTNTQAPSLLDGVLAFSTAGSPLTTKIPGGGHGAVSAELEAFLSESAVTPVELLEAQLKESLAAQPAVMAHVMRENDRFDAARLKDGVTLGRQKVVMDVERAVEDFKEIDSQLAAGASFYADLVSRLQQLVQTVDGFVYAQEMVRKETEQEVKRQREQPPASFVSTMASDAELARRLADELNMQQPDVENEAPGHLGYALPTPPSYQPPAGTPNAPVSINSPASPSQSSSVAPPFPTFATPVPPPPAYDAVAPSASAPSSTVNESTVRRLAEMGFSREAVFNALESNDNDEDRALNQLLS
mmetsp:Transcript_34135/g.67871  ORF Transcript_34135/g.67871 Transcript_34135/m.67871 type:complete len:912 (+) Transcript_34135:105-2840(+)